VIAGCTFIKRAAFQAKHVQRTTMKSSQNRFILLIAASLLAWAPSSSAQEERPAQDQPRRERPAGGERERRGPAGGANRFEQIAERLKLNDDQKGKLRPIFTEETTKLRELRQDTTLTQEQRRTKTREIREQYLGKMKPILTTEQFEQLKKIREETPARGRRGERPGGGAGAPERRQE
jgi:Spy/CpxP family protein refolding chaperone